MLDARVDIGDVLRGYNACEGKIRDRLLAVDDAFLAGDTLLDKRCDAQKLVELLLINRSGDIRAGALLVIGVMQLEQ